MYYTNLNSSSMEVDTDVKIIRALWGNSEKIFNEIPATPIFNEFVYVWGASNYEILTQRGYECKLVDSHNFPFPSKFHVFFQKLLVFKNAVEKYGKILFLDWDCTIVKPLDFKFWDWFRGKKYAAPLYCYPKYIKNQLIELNPSVNEWMNLHYSMLEKFSWVYENFYIIPNACMVYISDLQLCLDMINSYQINGMGTLEEFAMYSGINCDLNLYIKNYEIPFVYGRSNSDYFTLGASEGNFAEEFNNFLDSKIKKDIYFIHN